MSTEKHKKNRLYSHNDKIKVIASKKNRIIKILLLKKDTCEN